LIAFVILPAFLVISVATELVARRRCQSHLQVWMTDNHLELKSTSRMWLPTTGPFKWSEGRSHRVFRVNATDADGHARQGFARVGGGMGGVAADIIEVRWS
jgi:hypothetical protein